MNVAGRGVRPCQALARLSSTGGTPSTSCGGPAGVDCKGQVVVDLNEQEAWRRSPSVSWRLIGDPQRFIDDAVEFRQFCCPACGGLIENEVCRAQDPVLHDMELEGE
jgi:Acetone carboxylase gamma subunit